jgi:hypothetical protein
LTAVVPDCLSAPAVVVHPELSLLLPAIDIRPLGLTLLSLYLPLLSPAIEIGLLSLPLLSLYLRMLPLNSFLPLHLRPRPLWTLGLRLSTLHSLLLSLRTLHLRHLLDLTLLAMNLLLLPLCLRRTLCMLLAWSLLRPLNTTLWRSMLAGRRTAGSLMATATTAFITAAAFSLTLGKRRACA